MPDLVEADTLIDEILGFEDMDAAKELNENEEGEEEFKDEESKQKEEI